MIKKLLLIALFLTCPSLVYGVLPQTDEEFYHYVQSFVKKGGNVNAAIATDNDLSSTLLHYAAENGYTESALYLLRHGAHVDATDSTQQTPLHGAVINGHVGMIYLLVGRQANVNAKDSDHHAPLHYLSDIKIENMSPIIARVLLEAGADVNAEDGSKCTPLHQIVSSADELDKKELLETLRVLLQAGADPLKIDDEGESVLHVAIKDADSAVVESLLTKTHNPNIPDKKGDAPLHKACALRDMKKIELLIAKGANLMVKNDIDQVPLMAFLKESLFPKQTKGHLSHDELVQLLLTAYDEVPVYDKSNNNLLHYGFRSTSNHAVLASLIHNAGHLINKANDDGQTPLYYALDSGDIPSTMMLLRAGADVEICDQKGITPLGCVLLASHLDRTTKLKLTRLLMMYSGVFKEFVLRNELYGDLKLSAMKPEQLHPCGIDKDFVTQAMSPEGFDECCKDIMAACGAQEYGVQRTPSIMRTAQRRELTGRWHPYANKR